MKRSPLGLKIKGALFVCGGASVHRKSGLGGSYSAFVHWKGHPVFFGGESTGPPPHSLNISFSPNYISCLQTCLFFSIQPTFKLCLCLQYRSISI